MVHKWTNPDCTRMDDCGKCMVKLVSTGSYWTTKRQRHAGYDVDPVCPLCGQPDGLVHRMWWCPVLEEDRQKLMKPEELEYMRAMAEDDPIATMGIFLHPADVVPAPAEESFIKAVIKGRDRWGQEIDEEAQLEDLPLIHDDGFGCAKL